MSIKHRTIANGVSAALKLTGMAAMALSFIMMMVLAGCPTEDDSGGGGGGGGVPAELIGKWEGTTGNGAFTQGKYLEFTSDNKLLIKQSETGTTTTFTVTSVSGGKVEIMSSGANTSDGSFKYTLNSAKTEMTVSDQEMNGNSAGYAVYTKQTPSGGGLTVTAAGSATSVAKGGTLQFSVSPAEAVTWSITTSGRHSGTTISTTGGLLTVAAAETQPSLEIKAESTADPSKSGTATVTVTGGGGGEGVTFGAVTYNSSSGNCSAPFTYTGGGTPSAEMLFATNANKATANPMGWDWNGDQWEDMTISGGTASLTGTTTSKAKYQSYAYVYVVIEVGSGLNAKQYWHQLKPAASGGS